MNIVVIDGLGGGLGHQIIKRIRDTDQEELTITAVGTNALATANMLQAGADRGATGENALRVCSEYADIIVGPIGIIVPNAMLGEVTPAMAEVISKSKAKRLLLAVKQPHINLVGVADKPLSALLDEMVQRLKSILNDIAD